MIYPQAKVSERTKLFVPGNGKFHIGDFCLITVPELVISEGAHINAGTKIIGRGRVVIGRYSVVSFDCRLMTSTDCPTESLASDYLPIEIREIKTGDIQIGENCFIGDGTTIMPGVTIYDGAVIGANSYIDKDVKDWTVKIPGRKDKARKRFELPSFVPPP